MQDESPFLGSVTLFKKFTSASSPNSYKWKPDIKLALKIRRGKIEDYEG